MIAFAHRGGRRARVRLIAETPSGAPSHACGARGARRVASTGARRRIALCAFTFLAAYAALAARLAAVSFADDREANAARPNPSGHGLRAEIVDRNGALLAANLPMVALEVSGRDVWDADETAAQLTRVLRNVDEADLAQKLRMRRYVELREDLTPAERDAVFALGLPGTKFVSRSRRYYPQEALAAHVVGHDARGKGGVMGLERLTAAREPSGQIAASIDIRVQLALEEELDAAMKTFAAEAAWGALLDVNTGEVLALASLPDFNPNAPGAAPADWRRNRAVYDRYELGSAFKAFTAAAALEAGVAREFSTYDARGSLKVADRTINDYHGENRVLSFTEVIQHSSNIGAARMAADLGPERLRATLGSLGLLDPVPVELAENRAPEPPSHWGPVETATVAYGHGIAVTPLHLLAAYAAVVNGGVYRRPTFLKTGKAVEERTVFSARTSAIMRRVLRRVITDGTAKAADVPGYFVIGKTATADKPDIGGYDRGARIATFVGAFPGYEPRFAVLLSLDNPKPTKATFGYATAGWNAAPAAARFIGRAAPTLGVLRTSDTVALAAFHQGYASADAASGERRR
jgi:cell division protein FtsI (penicillin-binding protein 3)